jgi:hypothetical protein
MGRKHHHHHGAEAKPSGHHRKHAPSNNSAAANYIQAVVRAYVLRKSQHRDLLRARLEAYAKWTPATFFRAYCKFAQQTTTARALRGARYLLRVSLPTLAVLEDHLDEARRRVASSRPAARAGGGRRPPPSLQASFLCLCMDCELLGTVTLQYAGRAGNGRRGGPVRRDATPLHLGPIGAV